MKESRDENIGNSQYTYEVTKIEVLTSNEPASTSNGMPRSHYESLALAKLLDGVEKSYDSGTNILDENAPSDTMLRDLGLPGFVIRDTLTDNELRYILWRSYLNLTAGGRNGLFAVVEDIAMQHRLQVGNYAPSRRRQREARRKPHVAASQGVH